MNGPCYTESDLWAPARFNPRLDNLTVVITNWQRAEFLWRAFQSCLEAGIQHIVVSSSAATSEVLEIHRLIKQAHPDTIIFSESEDSGSNVNWYRGVEAATTKWVQILHDDDALLPCYRDLGQWLGQTDMVCWDGMMLDGDGHRMPILQSLIHGVHKAEKLIPILMTRRFSPSPVAGCFKRSDLLETLQICASWGPEFIYHRKLLVGNDLLIWLMAARQCRTFRYLPQPLVAFGHHDGSATCMALKSKDDRLMGIYDRVRKLFATDIEPKLATMPALKLPSVTLVAIDSFRPERTVATMRKAMQQVEFASSVLVTRADASISASGITVLPLLPSDSRIERERFMITRITEAFSTEFCINIEWDAGILNPKGWDDSWFNYDFIGAPWRIGTHVPGFPTTTDNTRVGNTGFSLMSKRFADALAKISKPSEYEVRRASDIYVCVTLRPQLESLGIKFAPPYVAASFSCEDTRWRNQFGWHGKGTAHLNGFKL